MKNCFKKCISLFLCICMLCAVGFTGVLAADEAGYVVGNTQDAEVANVVGPPIISGTTMKFDGTQYIELNNLFKDTTSYTVTFSIKTTQEAPTNGLLWYNGIGLVDSEVASYFNDWGIAMVEEGKIAYGEGEEGMTGQDFNLVSETSINDGQWHTVAAIYNDGDMTLIVDGVTENSTTTGHQNKKDTSPTIAIGTSNVNKEGELNFIGMLDSVTLYTTALTPIEVKKMLTPPTIDDITAPDPVEPVTPDPTLIPTDETIDVTFNGTKIEFDVPPMLVETEAGGVTMIPIRFLMNAAGIPDDQITYDGATETVVINGNDKVIKLIINDTTAYVNDEPVTLLYPAIETEGRTLVPLRFVSESLGYSVAWFGNAVGGGLVTVSE